MVNEELSPYQRLGGEVAVRKLVYRFYELMDSLPQAQQIRAMHADDLSGSADKLYKFLSGWLAGWATTLSARVWSSTPAHAPHALPC